MKMKCNGVNNDNGKWKCNNNENYENNDEIIINDNNDVAKMKMMKWWK